MEGFISTVKQEKKVFFNNLKLCTTFSHLYHDGSRIIYSFMGTRRPPKRNIEASLYVHSDSNTCLFYNFFLPAFLLISK